MPITLPVAYPAQNPSLEELQQAYLKQDIAMLRRVINNSEQPELIEPALTGLCVRALRATEDSKLDSAFRRDLVAQARTLPSWPLLQALAPARKVDTLPRDCHRDWLLDQSWIQLLERFAREGDCAATRLADISSVQECTFVSTQYTLLSAAILTGHVTARDFLLFSTSDVDAKDDDGHTALWSACEVNDAQSVRILLDWGARPFGPRCSNDDTPLLFDALRLSSPLIVQDLLRDGIEDVGEDQAGYNLWSSFLISRLVAAPGPPEIDSVVEVLLAKGAAASEVGREQAGQCFGALLLPLARRSFSEMDAYHCARAIQLLCANNVAPTQPNGLGAITFVDCGLPPLSPKEPETGEQPSDEADGKPAVVWDMPLNLCVLAREFVRVQAAARSDSDDGSPAREAQSDGAHEESEADNTFGYARRATPALANLLLLTAAKSMLVALGPNAQAPRPTARDWAERFDDKEMLTLLGDEFAADEETVLQSFGVCEPSLGLPDPGWLRDHNLSRCHMRFWSNPK